VASFVVLIRRFRRSRGDERQQMKWFVTAAALVFAVELPVSIVETDSDVVPLIANLALLAVPVSVGVAILKYRLYEIDVVIRKSVVYAILVGLILGVWVLVVWLGQSVLVEPLSDHDELLVLGGVVLGVLFLPLRRLATRIADRLVFRSRATPYEVLRSFADRVGGTYASEDVLPRMARVLAEATGPIVRGSGCGSARSFASARRGPSSSTRSGSGSTTASCRAGSTTTPPRFGTRASCSGRCRCRCTPTTR
jgi:two-component system NarL family sensor kinase